MWTYCYFRDGDVNGHSVYTTDGAYILTPMIVVHIIK